LRFYKPRHMAQGDLGHMPSASLSQYASLSFVVRGRGKLWIADWRYEMWEGIGQRAMPLEVGGALRLRLEAPAFAKATARQGRQRSEVRSLRSEDSRAQL
jgi:hypothetical protein